MSETCICGHTEFNHQDINMADGVHFVPCSECGCKCYQPQEKPKPKDAKW